MSISNRLIHLSEATSKDWTFRGTHQRNRGLKELYLMHLMGDITSYGAIYFADDDNTYDASFLDQIRWVKRVAVFNVGLISGQLFEGPDVRAGRVVGWKTAWPDDRAFCIDMAGFVVNLNFFLRRGPIDSFLFRKTKKVTLSSFYSMIYTMIHYNDLLFNFWSLLGSPRKRIFAESRHKSGSIGKFSR